MATDESSINNASILSDTEDMEDSQAEGSGESDSQEVLFRPERYRRMVIQDTEEMDDGDVTEAMESSSSEDEAEEEERNIDGSSHNRPPRFWRIQLNVNSTDSSLTSEETQEVTGSDSDVSVISNVQEVGREFHSDRTSSTSNGGNSVNSRLVSTLSEDPFEEDETREEDDAEDRTNNEGLDETNSDIEVVEEIQGRDYVPLIPVAVAPSTSKEQESSTTSSSVHEDDESASLCPICFEPWSNVGIHRIVSLKCGHLFGKQCIERWIQKPGSTKCPQCNAKALKRDIRIIYAKNVKVEDTSERERLMQEIEKLKREKTKQERERMQQKMKISQDFKYINDLQKQLRLLQESAVKSSQSTSCTGKGYRLKLGLYQSIDLGSKNGSCRVMAFNEWMNMLVISIPSHVEMFPGFGMKKINTIDFKTENFYHLHSKQIRDFTFNSLKEDLLLSVGFDKVAKVTNVSSNSTVVSYNVDSLLWNCCWSCDIATDFFAGTASGLIYHFDTIANTEKPVKSYKIKGTGPVVSLSYVSSNPNMAFMPKGLLVTRLDSISFEELMTGEEECVSHDLLIEGTFTHTAFDPVSMHFLTTCRPNDRNLHVRHKLFALKSVFDEIEQRQLVIAAEIHSFQGSTTMKVIERSCLTTQNKGQTLLAIFNEESTNSVKVCDVRTTTPIQTVKTGVNIVDILPIKGRDGDFIAMLSEKCIKIYKWIPQF